MGRVIRGFDRHLNVVRMRFAQARRGDAHEAAPLVQLVDSASPGVEHRLTQPTNQLVGHCAKGPAVSDLALDALRDDLCLLYTSDAADDHH